MQIVILGMHRSGTSALARIVNLMGAQIGEPDALIPASIDNPKGFWERRDVALLNDRILRLAGGAWDDTAGLDLNAISLEEAAALDREIALVLASLDGRRPWVLKDPRLSLTLGLWRGHLECPVYLLAMRHPLEVAFSLSKRNELPELLGLALWRTYYQHAMAVLRTDAAPALLVDYTQMLADPAKFADDLYAELIAFGVSGLRKLSRREVEASLNAGLRNQVADDDHPLIVALQPIAETYDAIAAHHLQEVQGLPTLRDDPVLQGVLELRHREGVASRAAAFQGSRANRHESEVVELQQMLIEHKRLLDDSQAALDEARRLSETRSVEAERLAEVQAQERVVALEQNQALSRELERAIALSREQEERTKRETQDRDNRDIEAKALLVQRESAMIVSLDERAQEIRDAARTHATALRQLVAWFDESLHLQQATFSSMRWKLGNAVGRAFDLLRFRWRVRLAKDDLEEIGAQYVASREGAAGAVADVSTSLARLDATISEVAGRPAADTSLQPAPLAPAVAPTLSAVVSGNHHRTSSLVARTRALVSGTIGLAVRTAKWIVHRCIDILPLAPSRRELLRIRVFDLQQALLARRPSAAMIDDIERMSEHRWQHPPKRLTARDACLSPEPLDLSLVLFNSQHWLEPYFAALQASTYPLGSIRLLVTDHSRDAACAQAFEQAIEPIRHRFLEVRYQRASNAGFGKGHNRNLLDASSRLFFVCNVDGALEPDALAEVVAASRSTRDDAVAWELRQIPYEHPKYYDPVTSEVSWFSGACVVLKTDALREAGGFERRIFMYGEDVELSYRLRARGGRLIYVPRAVMRHETYAEANEFKSLQFLGSTLANAYLRLRYGRLEDIVAIPAMWISLVPVASAHGLFAAWMRSTITLLRNAPYFLSTRQRQAITLPFAGWDYGMRREGAFHVVTRVDPEKHGSVSIITRTYAGRSDLLRQAILSVANQTYPRIELIVTEDGGDEAAPLCRELAELTGLEIRHLAQPKGGRCDSGNAALAVARGEFIGFLDDDDLLFADHVESMLAVLARHSDVGAAYGLSWEVAQTRDEGGRCHEVMHRTVPEHRQTFSRTVLAHHNFMPIQAPIFRRTLYELYGGLAPDLEILEDWDLWRRYSFRHEFIFVEKTTSIYHVPAERRVAAMRQAQLDEYYQLARARFDRFEEAQQKRTDQPTNVVGRTGA